MVAINVREYGSPVMIIMRSNRAHAGCPVTARSSTRQTPDATIPRAHISAVARRTARRSDSRVPGRTKARSM